MQSDVLNKLRQPVTNFTAESPDYQLLDGYAFRALTHPANIYDAIVLRSPSTARAWGRKLIPSDRTLDEHITFINTHQIDKAFVIADDLHFLSQCPSLKHLCIQPSKDVEEFDYSPLYQLPQITSLICATEFGPFDSNHTCVDYSQINGLEFLQVQSKYDLNYQEIPSLLTLVVNNNPSHDLWKVFKSNQLDTLKMTQCKIRSLSGIEQSERMQCLYLQYNRSLQDISSLSKVKNTLRALRIENCPKISDFSVLKELGNLEYLHLEGSNKLPDISFIEHLKNLKTLILGMEVVDGNLLPCLRLSYVYCDKVRKFYNLNNSKLPKGQYYTGTDNIPLWRRVD